MKKYLGVIALVMVLMGSASALEITDIGIEPDKPRPNDTVNITVTTDAEDEYVSRVNLRVLENDTEITNTDLALDSGTRYSIADWTGTNIHEIAEAPVSYIYTVTAVGSGGETDTESIIVDVDPDTSIIEEPDSSEGGNQKILGIDIRTIVALGLILMLGYALIAKD